MKKLIIALSTVSAFFIALLCFGAKTYADDELPEATEPKVTEVVETTNEGNTDTIIEDSKEESTIDGMFEITEDQAKEIASVIGSYTNEKVEQLTISMYYAFGVMGIVLVVLFILLVVFAVGKAKNDANTSAIVEGIRTYLEQSNEENAKALKDILDLNGEQSKELLSKIFDSVKEAKFSKYASQKETLNKNIDEALSNITKVE